MKIVELDGKKYNLGFNLFGLKESQKLSSIRARNVATDGYSEIDDVVETLYCFLKACNKHKTEETERFTMALAAFWNIIESDFRLFTKLSKELGDIMEEFKEIEEDKKK